MNQPIEKFWRMVAQEAGSEPSAYDLMLFNTLGDPWSDDTTWAKQFTEELWKLPKSVKRLNLHINSPGGSVAEAQAIYSALADHASEKVVYIDGLAASAATIPAMAGHKVFIRSNANMMIHLPMALAVGNADKMREAISMLESVTESIINVYQKKSGLDRDEIRSLMQKETWFTAKEAVEKNFADEVRGVIKAAASVGHGRVIFNGSEFDLAPFEYKHTPAFPEALTMKRQPVAATAPPSPEPPVKEEPEAPPAPAPVEPPAPSEADEPKARLLATAMADFEHINPALAQAFHERGVQAERTRLAGLERFSDPACAGIVAAARADGRTAEQIALECYDVLVRAGRQDARRSDASVLANVKSGDAPFQGLGRKVNGTSPVARASAVSALVEAGKKAHKRN